MRISRIHSYRTTTVRHVARAYTPRNVEPATIFQMEPPCGQVTIEDVDDIYPICSQFSDDEQKYACYACYGMDMDKVEKYYHVVKSMETEYKKACEKYNKERAYHFRIGKMNIYISSDP